ncbi:accelerated cell death 11-like [Elaeis guineensis]
MEGGERPLRKLAEAFHDLAARVSSNREAMELARFTYACSTVLDLFKLIGIEYKFGEDEYRAKIKDIEAASQTISTVPDLIDADIRNNCVTRSGSHSRNLLRVKRALELIRVIFELLLASKDDTFMIPAAAAYAMVFAAHHEQPIKNAVSEAMYDLPTRSQLLQMVNEEEESANVQLKKYVDASAIVTRYIDEQFTGKGLGTNW